MEGIPRFTTKKRKYCDNTTISIAALLSTVKKRRKNRCKIIFAYKSFSFA
jgi:hypothetical protein